jgi:hypothetical protein
VKSRTKRFRGNARIPEAADRSDLTIHALRAAEEDDAKSALDGWITRFAAIMA